jgi:hypothetical protein
VGRSLGGCNALFLEVAVGCCVIEIFAEGGEAVKTMVSAARDLESFGVGGFKWGRGGSGGLEVREEGRRLFRDYIRGVEGRDIGILGRKGGGAEVSEVFQSSTRVFLEVLQESAKGGWVIAIEAFDTDHAK